METIRLTAFICLLLVWPFSMTVSAKDNVLRACPDCTGTTVTLNNVTFDANTVCDCAASVSITILDSVTVKKNAKVTFRAPKITVKNGFHAELGATVVLKQDGTVYYVSTQGNDQNDGLSKSTAFRTLDRALKAAGPGESIHILSGTYQEALMLENIGGANGFITIVGIGTKPVFDGQKSAKIGFWCENCQNLIFENLEFKNYSDVGIGFYLSKGITLQGLTVHHNGFKPQLTGWEIEGYGIHIDVSQNVTIKNNQVYSNGPNPRPDGVLGTGINTFECTDCAILDNASFDNIGGGILVEDGVNVLVEGNDIRTNDLDATEDEWWDGGIWLDGGHDVTIRNNAFTDNLGPGIQISDEDSQHPYGYVLENNISRRNYYGIFIWNLSKDDTWPDASILKRSGNTITDNTVKDVWIIENY